MVLVVVRVFFFLFLGFFSVVVFGVLFGFRSTNSSQTVQRKGVAMAASLMDLGDEELFNILNRVSDHDLAMMARVSFVFFCFCFFVDYATLKHRHTPTHTVAMTPILFKRRAAIWPPFAEQTTFGGIAACFANGASTLLRLIVPCLIGKERKRLFIESLRLRSVAVHHWQGFERL